MVRIKHRYLLVHILYPPQESSSTKAPNTTTTTTTIPDAVLFHAPTPSHVTASSLLHLLRTQVSLLFGDYGSGVLAGGLAVKYFSNATSTAIIRCSRAYYRLAWAALTFVTELPTPKRGVVGEACLLRVVRVSGTIKKAEREAVMRAQRMISTVQGGEDTSTTLGNVLGAGHDQDDVEEVDDEVMDSSE